jgi:hypothetical protein
MEQKLRQFIPLDFEQRAANASVHAGVHVLS